MGIEFIRKRAKPYKRRWDIGRRDLGTADLFTREPTCVGRLLPFDLTQTAALNVGDTVTVELNNGDLVARSGLSEVARAQNPPTDILSAVQHSCGIAKGLIEHVHGLARVAEISLC
jgi:hypothetical protein